MKNPPGFEKFYAAFLARMHFSESNGGDYSAESKKSSAVGKYQFLWDTWSPKIKSFAKEQGFGPTDKETFKGNPELQDAFFEHYAKTVVYPEVVKLSKGNTRNLDLDEIAQLYHMHPDSTRKYIKGGKWDIGKAAKTNSSLKKYLEEGKRGLDQFGADPVRPADVYDQDERKKLVDEYFTRKQEINDAGYHESAQKQRLQALNQQYHQMGLVDEINETVRARTQEEEQAFQQEKGLFKSFYDLFSNSAVNKDKVKLKASGGKPYVNALFLDKKSKAVLDAMAAQHPDIFKIGTYKEGSNEYYRLNFRLDGESPVAKYINDNVKKYNGIDLLADKGNIKDLFEKPILNTGDVPLHINKAMTAMANLGEAKAKELKWDKEYTYPEDDIIPHSSLAEISKDYGQDPKPADTEVAVTEKPEDKKQTVETIAVANKEVAEENRLAEFLNSEMELDVPDDLNYNKKDFAAELPFDAVAGGLLGIMGLAQQDNPIPKRDEQISAGVQDYVAKLAELSKMGLPPEVEADAKNKIASGWQLGMKNLVEASGGNRNLVLGNQASLDLSSMLAQSNLAIEDFKAKNEALYQYGQGAMYINEFNANRDIANKQLEQEVAFQNNANAGALIDAGFSTMISSLQEARENGPGSARHMLSSLIRQNAFGYDPEMKDDGSGSIKGTRSWYEQNVIQKVSGYNENLSMLRENYNMFDEDKKNFMQTVYGKTTDLGKLRKAAEFARDNNVSNPNMENLAKAIETDDYRSLLSDFKELPQNTPENASNFTDYLNTA